MHGTSRPRARFTLVTVVQPTGTFRDVGDPRVWA